MAYDQNSMAFYSERIPELINKSMQEDLSETEAAELQQWRKASERNNQLYDKLTSSIFIRDELKRMGQYDLEAGEKRLMQQISRPAPVISIMRRYVAAAIVVIALLGGLSYFFVHTSEPNEHSKFATVPQIKPGNNQAVLTLADGSTINLDSATNGLLSMQGSTGIVKQKDGQIVYQPAAQSTTSSSINAVQTPRGGQYEVVLPDGSVVKLNSLSRLDFPTVFTGESREVTLQGEGYFEVSKNAAKPFHVHVSGMDVQVTGTSFNINAYADEAVMKNTLFEGSIQVAKGDFRAALKPGQQLQYDYAAKEFTLVRDADLDAAAAWRNGMFDLDNADVPSLLRQIARWYDIEIVYAGPVPAGKFLGQIPRTISFQDLLQVLREGGLETKLEGRKLIVL